MNGSLFAAAPAGFDGPAYQQGLQGEYQPIAYDGPSNSQQSYTAGAGMMPTQVQPPFAAGEFAPIRSALPLGPLCNHDDAIQGSRKLAELARRHPKTLILANRPHTSAAQYHPSTASLYNASVPAQAPAFLRPQQQPTAAPPLVSRPPTRRASPDAASQRSQPQSSSHTPPTKYSMAAPPLPLTPQSQQSAADGAPAVTTPKSPQSPGGQTREAARVALLLSINRELLEEVQRLQDAGKGGAISQQQVQVFRSEGKPDKMASDEYIQCLRRVQANFTYLMPKAQKESGQSTGNEAKQLPGPAHMTPPPHMPEDMKQKYEQLKDLFPDWQGLDRRMALQQQQQQQQQQQNSSPRPGAQPIGANGATTSNFTTPTA